MATKNARSITRLLRRPRAIAEGGRGFFYLCAYSYNDLKMVKWVVNAVNPDSKHNLQVVDKQYSLIVHCM